MWLPVDTVYYALPARRITIVQITDWIGGRVALSLPLGVICPSAAPIEGGWGVFAAALAWGRVSW